MNYIWRRLTGRCVSCGQKLNSKQIISDRMSEINQRAARLTKTLGRRPQVQTCRKCQQIVFESEPGFVQSYLLIDLEQA